MHAERYGIKYINKAGKPTTCYFRPSLLDGGLNKTFNSNGMTSNSMHLSRLWEWGLAASMAPTKRLFCLRFREHNIAVVLITKYAKLASRSPSVIKVLAVLIGSIGQLGIC